jgi:hypothetical protein
MYVNDLIVGSKKANCGCTKEDPDCGCAKEQGVDGAVNVNVILDSANTFSRYTDMPMYSRNNPMYSTPPVITPTVVSPTVVPSNVITPIVNENTNPIPAQPQNIIIQLPNGQQTPAVVKDDGTVVVPATPTTPEQVVGVVTEKGGGRVNALAIPAKVETKAKCKEYFYPAFI